MSCHWRNAEKFTKESTCHNFLKILNNHSFALRTQKTEKFWTLAKVWSACMQLKIKNSQLPRFQETLVGPSKQANWWRRITFSTSWVWQVLVHLAVQIFPVSAWILDKLLIVPLRAILLQASTQEYQNIWIGLKQPFGQHKLHFELNEEQIIE